MQEFPWVTLGVELCKTHLELPYREGVMQITFCITLGNIKHHTAYYNMRRNYAKLTQGVNPEIQPLIDYEYHYFCSELQRIFLELNFILHKFFPYRYHQSIPKEGFIYAKQDIDLLYTTTLKLTPYASMHKNCAGPKGSCKKRRCLVQVCDHRFAFMNKVFKYESSLHLLVPTSAFLCYLLSEILAIAEKRCHRRDYYDSLAQPQ